MINGGYSSWNPRSKYPRIDTDEQAAYWVANASCNPDKFSPDFRAYIQERNEALAFAANCAKTTGLSVEEF